MSIINILQDFKYGRILYQARDRYIGQSIALYGEYSEGETALYRQLVKPGNTVVEVGANIGSLTIPLAQMVTETGRVLAFEPQRLIFQILCGNMALNNLNNVYCYNKGVGSKKDTIKIEDRKGFAPDSNPGGFAIIQVEEGYEIDIVPLDDLHLTACDFLKIDVEGMELEVFKGAEHTLKKFQPIIYTEASNAKKNLEIAKFLRPLGYKIYDHPVHLFNSNNYYGNETDYFKGTGYTIDGKLLPNAEITSFNWVCIPQTKNLTMKGFREIKEGERY